MPPRARRVVLTALLTALTLTAIVAGQQGGSGPPGARPSGVQRLGPEAGEPATDYLRRAGASLPAGHSGRVWALVQLDTYLAPEPAAELVEGTRLSRVILRVPLPRVQTALITRDLPGQQPEAELTAALRSAALDRLAAARAGPGGRPAAIAAAEGAELRTGCACVLALLVLGDGEALRALAIRPRVRAVHAALPGTSVQDLAISPLLPEQVSTAGPVPDDGSVPAISQYIVPYFVRGKYAVRLG